MQTVLLLASIQAFFLVAMLFSKRQRNLSDLILGSWLGLIGLHTLIYFVYTKFGIYDLRVMNLNASVPFLHGPLLYIYVDTLTTQLARFKKVYFLHFIPFAVFSVNHMFLQNTIMNSAHSHEVNRHLFDVSSLSNLVLLSSVPIYAIWSMIILARYRRKIFDTFSSIEKINLSWLRFLISAMVLVWLAVLGFFLFKKLGDPGHGSGVGHLILAPIVLFVYVTGYFGFKQTTIFSDVVFLTPESNAFDNSEIGNGNEPVREVDTEVTAKYRKSGLTENEASQTLIRLLAYMEEEKPFLDDKLNLPNVAADLGISSNHLSQVINDQRKQNFFDFVNSFRVEEVKQKIVDPKNDAFSLLAIGLDCGFGSKSSFNRIFKKFTGQTPSQYKKEIEMKSSQ